MRKLEQNEIDQILHLYCKEKYSISKLKTLFKLQFGDIKKILVDNGVTTRSQRESRKTYVYNEDYFSEIDTKDKAYWLGFIYADGFITKKTNGSPVFGMTLGEIEPLEKLNKYMSSNKPIGEYKKTGSYSDKSIEYKLAFCSPKLVSDLEKWGVVENKTFKLKFPEFLDLNLISHFIRGYFDGDGSVYLHIQKTKDKEYIFLGSQFSGIRTFLTDLSKYINAESCVYKDNRKQTDCWNIRLNSNIRSLNLYHYLYKDCGDLFLSRKREKFENFIKERGSTTTISNPIYGDSEYLNLCYLED